MCGRFAVITSPELLSEIFDLEGSIPIGPRYNIAPSQQIFVVRIDPATGKRAPGMVKWGLVPSWTKDAAIGNRMINTRSETAATKPSFRAAFKRRRCLAPADAYYEWRRGRSRGGSSEKGSAKQSGGKQPYCIRMKDEGTFAMAALWESWQAGEGPALETCAILTTAPNAMCAKIHDRMPAILRARDYEQWLDPDEEDAAALGGLLGPYPEDEMKSYPIGHWVNNPTHDDARCLEPVEEPPEAPSFF